MATVTQQAAPASIRIVLIMESPNSEDAMATLSRRIMTNV
jgi:hypothetical protein